MQPIVEPQSRPARSSSDRSIYLAALLLSLPALIPVAGAIVVPYLHHMVPTGFVENDMAFYVAYAKGHFIHGFHLLYGNRFAGYNTPDIYFQPQFFILGLALQLGLDPGVTFNLLGLLPLFFAAIAAALFYREVVGTDTAAKRIGFVCFFWGGGVFTVLGLSYGLIVRDPLSALWKYDLLRYDPTWGWWMLNFGRNLVYPTEAYFHGVFLLSLLFLIRRRLALSLALAALLSCSHPFAGLTLILVLAAYSVVELSLRSGAVNSRFLLGAILLAVLHVTYYLFWLNRFTDHRILQSQWQRAWLYPLKPMIMALMIVGGLAIWRMASSSLHCFRDTRMRLFAVWFLVVFALSHHNWFMQPRMPIHFAHGNDWMALFFLGAAPLIAFLDRLLKLPGPWVRIAAVILLVGFFVLDNATWLVRMAFYNEYAVVLTKTQSDELQWLSGNLKYGDMVVCQDTFVSYLVPTYTPARSWQGHPDNTPLIAQRHNEVERFFKEGRVLPEWKKPGMFYVFPAASAPAMELGLERRFGSDEFSIWTASARQ